jgi:hypothetical protein
LLYLQCHLQIFASLDTEYHPVEGRKELTNEGVFVAFRMEKI